jgi:protease IV
MSRRRLALLLFVIAWPLSAAAQETESAQTQEKKAAQTVAVIRVTGALSEIPLAEDFPFASSSMVSLREVLARLKKVAQDERISAVVLQLDGASMGRAQADEIRRAIKGVKEAGKPVYLHTDDLTMGKYVLLSAVSRISVAPTGDIWITGLYAESPHARGLLDKLGVVPDFFTCGEYKSAAEMFMRTAPSDEAKENLEWLIDGIFESYVQAIADGRGVPVDQARQWIHTGLYSAESAKKAGIIDAVEYQQDFLKFLKTQHGDDVEFDKRYGQKKPMEIDLSSPFGLFKFYADLLSGPSSKSSDKDAVAIVYVEGPIMPGSPSSDPFSFGLGGIAYSTPIREALDKAAADPKIKAVVLRVNSPGGSAVASEIILEATRRVKGQKPLVVSMGDVAGSGGYYVACGAETIFAEETTITGSIGVVVGKLATTGLWDKLGVQWDMTKRGQNAAILSSAEAFSKEERQQLETWMNEIYEVFKGHVTAIRGKRLKKDIEELAGGRVFTGKQALEFGLIDRLGGVEAAIAHVAQEAGLKDGEYDVRVLPKAPSFLDVLLGESSKNDDPHTLAMPGHSAPWLPQAAGLWSAAAPLVEQLDPERARTVRRMLLQLAVLNHERLSLTMPCIEIRP